MRKKITILLVALLGLGWFQAISSLLAIPKEYEAHLNAAKSYAEKEIYEDALKEYQSALQIKPENEEIKLAIADMNLKLGDKNAFVANCKELIFADTLNEEALRQLVTHYSKDGKVNEAIKLLRSLKETGTENEVVAELWKQYAGTYEIMGYSYESVKPFYCGYALAENGEHSLIVGTNGKYVLKDVYEAIGYFSKEENVVPVKKDGMWYYITTNESKKIVPDESFEQVGVISEGVISVQKNGRYNFADTK